MMKLKSKHWGSVSLQEPEVVVGGVVTVAVGHILHVTGHTVDAVLVSKHAVKMKSKSEHLGSDSQQPS